MRAVLIIAAVIAAFAYIGSNSNNAVHKFTCLDYSNPDDALRCMDSKIRAANRQALINELNR